MSFPSNFSISFEESDNEETLNKRETVKPASRLQSRFSQISFPDAYPTDPAIDGDNLDELDKYACYHRLSSSNFLCLTDSKA